MRALILILFPSIALAQFATGEIESLKTDSDAEQGNIYSTSGASSADILSTKNDGGNLSQKKGIYQTKGYNAENLSQAEGPIIYTRDANGDVYEIKASDCIAYAVHEPSADVTHSADADVSANPPLSPAFKKLIDQQTTFLDIPISNYIDGANFNIPLSDQARVNVGDILVKDGKAYFNGEEIMPQAVVECGSGVIATPSKQ